MNKNSEIEDLIINIKLNEDKNIEDLNKKNEEIEKLNKTIKELNEKIINLNNSIKMLENNNKILLNNKKDNDKNITDLTDQINILEFDNEQFHQRIIDLERSNIEKKNIIQDLNGQINNFDLENQELNKIISELEEKKNILEIELNEIRFVEKNKNGENQFNGGMEVQLQDLIQKNNAYIKEINILNDENKKLKKKLKKVIIKKLMKILIILK